jgi:hypothetical protein
VSSTVQVLELKKGSVAECDEQERREKEEENGDGVEISCRINDRLARHVIAIIRISTPE